jgi:hypothetical protein
MLAVTMQSYLEEGALINNGAAGVTLAAIPKNLAENPNL